MSNTPYNPGDKNPSPADAAAQSADGAMRGSQRTAHNTMDHSGGPVQNALSSAGATLDGLSSDAATLAHRGADSLRERSKQLQAQAVHARDTTRGYIQEAPLKSVLIAAATGAVIMLIGSMLGRSSTR